ncbi:Glycosyl hydrolase family 100 [Dillenia turbinata]|uniref:Alkaline/neutral invertase n=1 Tax=Dillenia turbinata TaxID=194707 RepID=A0AAN8VL39_9MAGN
MLAPDDSSADIFGTLNNRLVTLSFHLREYYWIDLKNSTQFTDTRRRSTHMMQLTMSSLATVDQSHAILDLIEAKWPELVAKMPLKICYPAPEGEEWPWSCHSGCSWPTLLWQTLAVVKYIVYFTDKLKGLFQLTVACIKMNRPEIAKRAVEIAERQRFVGKQSRLFQTWSVAGYLVSELLLAKPEAAKILINEEEFRACGCLFLVGQFKFKKETLSKTQAEFHNLSVL